MTLPASFKLPGSYFDMQFGVGPLSPLNAPRVVAIVDYGTAGPYNEPIPLPSSDDAFNIFGGGSHIYLGAKAFFDEYSFGTLYGVRMQELAGGTYAKKAINISGKATSGGSLRIFINELPPIDVSVRLGDDEVTQGLAIAAEVNRRGQYPVTSTGIAKGAEFAWKQKGVRGEQMMIRFEVIAITGSTYSVASTTTGVGDGSPQDALDSMREGIYHFVCTGIDFADVTTGINPFVRFTKDRAAPDIGLRGVSICAHRGTFGQVTALSLSQNAHRLQIGWCRNSASTTIETAAKMAAVRSLEEGSDPAHNFDLTQFNNLRGPLLKSDRITRQEANLCLNAGVTPIGIDVQGNAYLWRSITSYYQDRGGGPDYRVLDTSKVAVPDYLADFLQSDWIRLGYNKLKLRPDSPDQRPIEGVLTPTQISDWIAGVLYQHQDNPPVLLKNVDANMPNLVTGLDKIVPGRAFARIPVDVIDGMHQLDAVLRQVG